MRRRWRSPAARPVLAVQERTELFLDTTRSTEADNAVAASESRSLPTRMLAPPPASPAIGTH